jgi:long-chain fatty acid transport protein
MKVGNLNLCLGTLALLLTSTSVQGQGIIVPSAGPINSSMAGASTAAPVDFGASYWNPAIISALEDQEFLLGSALALPSVHMQSSLTADSVLGRFPPTNRFGEARSDSGVASALATGFSFRLSEGSPLTLGFGVFGLVGGGVNFPGSAGTPILSPRIPPTYFGVGPIYADLSLLSLAPMASLQLTDNLAVGGGPIITSGVPTFNPAFFAPNPKATDGLANFPAATNARPYWGAGFQVGLFYELNQNWNMGFSYKSPVWQEKWDFNAASPNLVGRRIGIQASLPEMFSWGVAYKGLPKTLIDVDVRYIDYANTSLFGTRVIDGGLGWKSVFAVALGGQYQATERLTIRAGYLYNTNPIPSPVTLFNVQAPGIIEHTLAVGASYLVTDNVTLSIAWMHGFRNAIEGSILQIPGSSVRLDAQNDIVWVGFNVRFGGSKRGSGANSYTYSADSAGIPPPSSWSGPYPTLPPASSAPSPESGPQVASAKVSSSAPAAANESGTAPTLP